MLTQDQFLIWLEQEPDMARGWLRHPRHQRRCTCHVYGMPWDGFAWADGTLIHFADGGDRVCQPAREVVW